MANFVLTNAAISSSPSTSYGHQPETSTTTTSVFCVKPKPPHSGVRFINPKDKSTNINSKYNKNAIQTQILPNDVIIFSCLTTDHKTTIKCLESGKWAEMPECPNPANLSCPDLPAPTYPLRYNTTNGPPYKIGQIITFTCDMNSDNQILTPNSTASTSTSANSNNSRPSVATLNQSNHSPINFTGSIINNNNFKQTITYANNQQPIGYNLTGSRTIKCLPTARWNGRQPICVPIPPPEIPSRLSYFLATTFLLLFPFVLIISIFVYKWHKKQQQRARWKQYFTDYTVRTSRTRINISGGSSLSKSESPHYEIQQQLIVENTPKMREHLPITDL